MVDNPDAFKIDDFEITQVVSTGGRISASYRFSISESIFDGAIGIGGSKPDYCTAPDLGGGVTINVRMRIGTDIVHNRDYCWPFGQSSTNRVEQTDFLGPVVGGEYDVTLEAFAQSDGEQLASRTRTVHVSSSDGGGGSCPEGFERNADGECVPADDDGGIIGGIGDSIEDVGTLLVIGFAGLLGLKAVDALGQPEEGEEDADSEGVDVPLPLDQREDDDEEEGA